MEITHVIDAISAAFFALLGIWSAVGQRHWFLRTTVVAAFLLVCLLVPAYEVVIEYGLAIILITIGVWIARGEKTWRLRFSMRTLLLLMVVAAVVSAVLSSAPDFHYKRWLWLVGIGTLVASIALICLWIVFGKNLRWWRRVLVGLLGFALLAAFPSTLSALEWVAAGASWQAAFSQLFSWYEIQLWFENGFTVFGLGVSIIIAVLLLARDSRWFDSRPSGPPIRANWKTIASRSGLVTLMLAIFLPLFYIGYRLATPTPIPVVEVPEPNGHDDLLAAGNMLTDSIFATAQAAGTLAIPKLEAERNNLAKVIERVDLGLKKKCLSLSPFPPRGDDYALAQRALYRVRSAIVIDIIYLERTGQTAAHTQACLRLIRFEEEADRGQGLQTALIGNGREVGQFQKILEKLSPAECRELAQELMSIDSSREPIPVRMARQRIIDQHRGWMRHMRRLLKDWSGEDAPHHAEIYMLASLRILIAELGAHAYLGDTGELPAALDDLVPKYLPRVPDDPLGDGPINYLVENGRYKIYSFGWDRDDDLGEPVQPPDEEDGDIVFSGPAKPL
ncbi:MAG: hypothetical protein GXP26_08865 [Planctomycetes bacterium]|nr:hypothetical protein [Planctomycetota bacterium]